MKLSDPKPRNRDADCLMSWDAAAGAIVLDFRRMPLEKLASLRELTEGFKAVDCHNWPDALESTMAELANYLTPSRLRRIGPGDRVFTIKVWPAPELHQDEVAGVIEHFLKRHTNLSVA